MWQLYETNGFMFLSVISLSQDFFLPHITIYFTLQQIKNYKSTAIKHLYLRIKQHPLQTAGLLQIYEYTDVYNRIVIQMI